MKVRAAQLFDLPAITSLLHASFTKDVAEFMTYMQNGISNYLGSFLLHPSLCSDRTFLVAVLEDERVVAFAQFGRADRCMSFLSYICVDEQVRGQGVAATLIKHYLSERPELSSLQLDVFEDNQPAVRLYRKLSFVPVQKNGWWVRSLPDTVSEGISVSIDNLPHALASYQQFGFCEFIASVQGKPLRFGRIGSSTLRCFTSEVFMNQTLLAAVHTLFPEMERALLIAPLDDDVGFGQPLKTSVRMNLSLSDTALVGQ